MLIFQNFISRCENFKSRDSSSTRKLTRHSDVDDALNAWMMRHSRHHAARLGGGPWEVKRKGKLRWRSQITKRSRLALVCSDQTPDGCRPAPNNEQSKSDRLGPVYSLKKVSVSGVRAVLQILIGNRCTVDKAADSMCMLVVYWCRAR